MGHRRGRSRGDVIEEYYSSSDEYDTPIEVTRVVRDVRQVRGASTHRHQRHSIAGRGGVSPAPVIINNRLDVPVEAVGGGGRMRAASTGGQPAPIYLVPGVEQGRGASRHREKHYHYHRSSSSSRSRSRSRSHRREDEMRRELERLRMADRAREDEKKYDEGRAKLRAEIEELERREKQARDKFEREEEDRKKREKEAKERALRQYEDDQRAEKDRKELIRRQLEDEEQKHKEEVAAIIRAEKEKAEKAKKEKEAMLLEFKAEEEKKEREKKAEEERIILEAEFKKKKKEAEDKETKERIARELEDEKRKKKEEEEKKEKEWEANFRRKAIEAGYSDDYTEDVLYNMHKKDRRHATPSPNRYRHHNELLIDAERPTYIRIHRKHILPETLDSYKLRWDYDNDRDFIIIKDYVDHKFQTVLFEDTKMRIRNRKLITPGYEKDTITTLRPRPDNDVVVKKKNGQLYIERPKNRSRSRSIGRLFAVERS